MSDRPVQHTFSNNPVTPDLDVQYTASVPAPVDETDLSWFTFDEAGYQLLIKPIVNNIQALKNLIDKGVGLSNLDTSQIELVNSQLESFKGTSKTQVELNAEIKDAFTDAFFREELLETRAYNLEVRVGYLEQIISRMGVSEAEINAWRTEKRKSVKND